MFAQVDTIRADPGEISELHLADEPEVRIDGAADGPGPTFARLGEGAWLPDGRIVVLDRGALRIHLFGPSGEYLRSFGSGGEGPGELKSATTVSTLADSLFVYDRSLARVSIFHPSEGYIRSIHVRGPYGGAPPYKVRVIGEGRFAAYQWRLAPSLGEDPRLEYRRAWFSILDEQGEPLGAPVPFAYTYSAVHEQGAVLPRPYAARALLAVCDGRTVMGAGYRFSLSIRGLKGEALEAIRWPRNRQSVNYGGEMDSLRPSWEERYPRYVDLIFHRELLPEHRPAIKRVRCGEQGRLWVGRFEPFHAPVRQWWILSEDSEPLGWFHLPPGARLLDADGDRVLLVEQNDLGVESLTVRQIR